MSHFYGDMTGNRNPVTRTATKNSGITTHVRGWNVGVEIFGKVEDGIDVFDIYITSGSSHKGLMRHLLTVKEGDI